MTAVAIAPDGTWLASGGNDGWVRIWDVASSQQRAALPGRGGPERVAIAPNGTWLASVGEDGSVRIWDLTTNGISALMRVDSQLQDCAWSPSSQSLAVAGSVGLYHFTFKPLFSGTGRQIPSSTSVSTVRGRSRQGAACSDIPSTLRR